MPDIDVDDVDDKPEKIKKSGGFLGKLIAVILGLIIGILAGAGGMVGIGYLLVFNTDIKTNIGTINGIAGTNINFTDFLDESYGNKTVVSLVGDTVATLQKISRGEGTLNNLNEISPLIGNLIVGEDGNSGLVKTLNDYYLNVTAEDIMNKSVVKPAGAEKDPDKYLMDYLMERVNDVPVASFLIKMGYPLNDTLLTICCGVEFVDWEKNPDGTIKMLGDSKQLTLGEFLSEDLEQAIYRLPIDAIMPVSLSDRVMMMLAYGDDFCYHTEERNGKTVVVMNQVFYTYDTVSGKLFDARGTQIAPSQIANANFTQGTCQVQVDANTTHYLKAETLNGERITLYAYSANDYTTSSAIFYTKTTLNDLNSGAIHLVEDMYLKDVLDITAKSDKMLISLAYGVEGEDYIFVEENGTKKIQSINPPRTIKELRERGEKLIYEIYLADVIDAEPEETVTMYILYGKENMHYSVEAGGVINMLQRQVAVVGNEVYNEYGDVKIGTLTGNTFTENGITYTLGVATGKTLTLSDNSVATMYYVVDEDGAPVNFNRTTLGDLEGNSPILQHITTRLTFGNIIGEDTLDGHAILSKLKDVYIADMTKAINDMTVGDIYGSDNLLLKAVKDIKLEKLGDAVDSLTVGHLFGDRDPVTDEYIKDEDGNIVISGNPILNALSKATFSNLATEVKALQFTDVFYDNLWEENASGNLVMKPVWKYMFFTSVDDTVITPDTPLPQYYIVSQEGKTGIDDMMKNMTKNMQNTKLLYLVNDGLITFQDENGNEDETAKENFLKSYVIDPITNKEMNLKDMTVIDVLNYIANNSLKA